MTRRIVGGLLLMVIAAASIGLIVSAMFIVLITGTVQVDNGSQVILTSPIPVDIEIFLRKMTATYADSVEYREDPFQRDGFFFSRCHDIYDKVREVDRFMIATAVMMGGVVLCGLVSIILKARFAWIPILVGILCNAASIGLMGVALSHALYIYENYDTCITSLPVSPPPVTPPAIRPFAAQQADDVMPPVRFAAGIESGNSKDENKKHPLNNHANDDDDDALLALDGQSSRRRLLQSSTDPLAIFEQLLTPGLRAWYNGLTTEQKNEFISSILTGNVGDISATNFDLGEGGKLLISGVAVVALGFLFQLGLLIAYCCCCNNSEKNDWK